MFNIQNKLYINDEDENNEGSSNKIECISFFKKNYKSIVSDSVRLNKIIDYLKANNNSSGGNNNNNNSNNNCYYNNNNKNSPFNNNRNFSNSNSSNLVLDDCIQSSIYTQSHKHLEVLLMCLESTPTFKRQLLDQLTLVYVNHLHFQLAITDSQSNFKLKLASPKYQSHSKKRGFESLTTPPSSSPSGSGVSSQSGPNTLTATNPTTQQQQQQLLNNNNILIDEKSKLLSSPQTKELRSSLMNQQQHYHKSYHLYKHYDEYILSIHEYMISLLDRNGKAWYLDIIQWIIRTLCHLNQMILSSNKSNDLTTSSTSNISNASANTSTTPNPSIIIQNSLRYLSIRNLLSLLLHITKDGIDHLFKQTKLLESNNNSWIVLFISAKYPIETIGHILKGCLDCLPLSNGNDSGNENGIENQNGKIGTKGSTHTNGNNVQNVQFKLLEYLAVQFKEQITSIISNQFQDKQISPPQLLNLLYQCPTLISIAMPVLIDQFQPIFNNLEITSLQLMKSILVDRNSYIDASSLTKIISLLLECIDKNSNNNSQAYSLFMSIVTYLEKALFEHQSNQLLQGLSCSLFLFCQYILNRSPTTTTTDYQPLISLTTSTALTNSKYCQQVLVYFLSKTRSKQLFSEFGSRFQVVWPNIIYESVCFAIDIIDSMPEKDSKILLDNLFYNYLSKTSSKTNNNSEQVNSVLRAVKSKWYIFLRLLDHPSISVRRVSIDILEVALSESDFQSSFKDLLDMRIFGERLLNIIFNLLLNFNNPLTSANQDEYQRIIIIDNLKSLYKSICNISLFNLSWGLALLLDYSMDTKYSDFKLKMPTTYVIHPANAAQTITLDAKENVEIDLILYPNVPLSQPLPYDNNEMMATDKLNTAESEPDENETLLQSNFKRKYYQYKFLDMNQPRHLPFKHGSSLDNSSNYNQNNTTLPFNYSQLDNQFQIKELIESLLQKTITKNNLKNSNNNNNSNTNNSNNNNDKYCQEKLSIFTELLLQRVLLPSHMNPSYENYQDILPKHSNFERDVYLRKLFHQDTVLWDLLEIISYDGREFCKCLEVIKSLLVNEISYWYSEKFVIRPSKSTHFKQTCTLIRMLSNSAFIPAPLNQVTELFDRITSEEISFILMTIWNFIKYHQPNANQFTSPSNRAYFTETKVLPNLDVYTQSLKSIFHNHISELASQYGRFFSLNSQTTTTIPPTPTSTTSSISSVNTQSPPPLVSQSNKL